MEKTLQCCMPPVLSDSSRHCVCSPCGVSPVTAVRPCRTGSPAAEEGPCSGMDYMGFSLRD